MEHIVECNIIMRQRKKAITLSVYEFVKKFPTEDTARLELENMLWGSEPRCPRCQSTNINAKPARKGYFCNPCRKNLTFKTDTVFAESNLKCHLLSVTNGLM